MRNIDVTDRTMTIPRLRWEAIESRHRVVAALAGVAATLIALNLMLGGLLLIAGGEENWATTMLRTFDLNSENPIPTWFAGALLITSSVLLARVALRTGGRDSIPWWVLSGIFAYLAVDETLAIHERSMEPLREALDVGGVLYFAWVIPGMILVAIVGIAFIPFLRRLEPKVRRLFVIAGTLYVGGALVLELVGGWLFDTFGTGIATDVTATIEESMEMAGAIVFISALLYVLSQRSSETLPSSSTNADR